MAHHSRRSKFSDIKPSKRLRIRSKTPPSEVDSCSIILECEGFSWARDCFRASEEEEQKCKSAVDTSACEFLCAQG